MPSSAFGRFALPSPSAFHASCAPRHDLGHLGGLEREARIGAAIGARERQMLLDHRGAARDRCDRHDRARRVIRDADARCRSCAIASSRRRLVCSIGVGIAGHAMQQRDAAVAVRARGLDRLGDLRVGGHAGRHDQRLARPRRARDQLEIDELERRDLERRSAERVELLDRDLVERRREHDEAARVAVREQLSRASPTAYALRRRDPTASGPATDRRRCESRRAPTRASSTRA